VTVIDSFFDDELTSSTPLDAAAGYAARGWRVIPIRPATKQPIPKQWQLAATTDAAAIERWWQEAPDAGIGIATGAASGIFVLDVDTASGKVGAESLATLEANHGPLPDTYEVVTGSGGRHLYFKTPTGIEIPTSAGRLGTDLDIRGEGGQVLAPPTVHLNGTRYEVEASTALLDAADAPAWLVTAITAQAERAPRTPPSEPTSDRPGDLWAAATSWAEILEPDGWTLHHTDRSGEQHWTRPGKERRDGTSATVNYGGADTLKVFTSSVPGLIADATYTKIGYLAATRHGGDHGAAARGLRSKGFHAPEDHTSPAELIAPQVLRLADPPTATAPPAKEPDAPATRRITLTPASTIKPRPVLWWWRDRIALGSLALLGGREGIGKSMCAYQIAADATRGRLPGQFFGVPKAVIIAATEDSWEHTIVPRLMAAGADCDRVYRADVVTSEGTAGQLSLPRDLDALGHHIADVDAAMVLLDPLMSRIDASLDTHKDAEVRLALEPLVALADRCTVAVIGLIHVNKSISTDPLTMLMASRAFAAVARAVLFVTRDPDDENRRILGQPKNNLGRSDLPSLTFNIESVRVDDSPEGAIWTGRVVWGVDDPRSIGEVLTASAEGKEASTATDDAAGWLLDYLTLNTAVAANQIKADGKAEGHSESTLKRARQKIGAGASSRGYPRRSYWSKPGMSPDDVDAYLDAVLVDSVGPDGGESEQSDLTGLDGPTKRRSQPVGSVGPTVQAPTRVGPTDGAER
jgi:hypothetical protein